MEIGGYRELDLRKGNEYYTGSNVARLNTGRAGIFHALRCYGLNRILIPNYECSTVGEFLLRHGVEVAYYHVNSNLRPLISQDMLQADAALLIVNYFGMLSREELFDFVAQYSYVIFDNTQAFYSAPVEGSYCVYSPRKFFGVPDGCYVLGENATEGLEKYKQDISGDTASFLLKRIESGGNNNYSLYLKNEERLERSDVLQMSDLTRALLDNIDYVFCAEKRRENFSIADSLFHSINQFQKSLLRDNSTGFIPMVYPLIVEDELLRTHLKKNSIFVGQWWKYLLRETSEASIEHYYSKYLIPIQIDQRYSKEHLLYTAEVINRYLSGSSEETCI